MVVLFKGQNMNVTSGPKAAVWNEKQKNVTI